MKKKFALMATSLVLVAALAVGGTLAWLTTTTGTVRNTFTVGDITMSLDEAEVTKNEDGTWSKNDDRTETGVEYASVYPGAKLPKDPTVHIGANSESCYVYLAVYNSLPTTDATFKYVTTDENGVKTEHDGINPAWREVPHDGLGVANEVHLYEYVGTSGATDPAEVSAGEDLPALFDIVAISGTIEDMSDVENAKIMVVGYAHQSKGVDSDRILAYAAEWLNNFEWETT